MLGFEFEQSNGLEAFLAGRSLAGERWGHLIRLTSVWPYLWHTRRRIVEADRSAQVKKVGLRVPGVG